jgi:hypothetical protein
MTSINIASTLAEFTPGLPPNSAEVPTPYLAYSSPATIIHECVVRHVLVQDVLEDADFFLAAIAH